MRIVSVYPGLSLPKKIMIGAPVGRIPRFGDFKKERDVGMRKMRGSDGQARDFEVFVQPKEQDERAIHGLAPGQDLSKEPFYDLYVTAVSDATAGEITLFCLPAGTAVIPASVTDRSVWQERSDGVLDFRQGAEMLIPNLWSDAKKTEKGDLSFVQREEGAPIEVEMTPIYPGSYYERGVGAILRVSALGLVVEEGSIEEVLRAMLDAIDPGVLLKNQGDGDGDEDEDEDEDEEKSDVPEVESPTFTPAPALSAASTASSTEGT